MFSALDGCSSRYDSNMSRLIIIVLCLFFRITVTSTTPNIISYNDVIIKAISKQTISKQLYRDVVKIQDLQKLMRDNMYNDAVDADFPYITPSARCANDTELVFEEAMNETEWAMQMLDAWSKPGSNIMGGQLWLVGSYKECIDIGGISNNGHLFAGRYCTAIIPVTPGPIAPITPGAITTDIRIGLCVPSTCHGRDVTGLVNLELERLNSTLRVGETICQKDLNYDSKAISVLCILTLFVVAMIIGTLYDIIVKQLPKWRAQASRKISTATRTPNSTVNIKDHSLSYESTPLLSSPVPPILEEGDGPVGRALLAFSVYSNAVKILATKHSPGSLTAVHGIRFITMTWVILGHTVVFAQSAALNPIEYERSSVKDWTFQAIANATVAVDTFFTISGLLVCYLILKELTKGKGRINWLMFYFHRFWRLTPPYMLVIMVYVNLFPYLGAGPFWPQDGIEPDHCSNWWTNLLYVNNLVNTKKGCMSWSWYLANDMQFYTLSPLIFIPFYYSRIAGVVSSSVFLLATSITTGIVSSQDGLPASLLTSDPLKGYDFFLDYYIKPYCRMGPYIVGLLAGYVLFRTDCKLKINKYVNAVCWMAATGVAVAILYGLYDDVNGSPLSVDVAALYNSVSRTAWGACIAWVVVACATGNGGPVNSLLSWPALLPVSRLTYTAYLIHPVVMCAYYFGRQQLFVLSTVDVIWAFLGNVVATYVLALPTSLAFEAPMMGLEKAFLHRNRS